MTTLRDSYDRYSGLYVNKVSSFEHHSGGNVKQSCIQFSHATIYEVVGKVLGDKCPEIVVQYGESGYFYERTYTAEAKDNASQNVFIPVSVYGLLVERIVHDVIDKQPIKRVVKHSALQQCPFLKTLKDELQKN
ncbi:hypothetical protein CHS0354_009802 [Potamilus streckersoni]|uniref:Uncharacterized protein n=1 Tax=Potamilus streckersoni TaxID=2493646 RepID=A0AAE0SRE9_9BIVA|nr:hypothetical protein CHS0354_009802 [Potamilus streckersoni]